MKHFKNKTTKELISEMHRLMPKETEKNKFNMSIELTKKAPDGKVYAIARENNKYYIMESEKKNNILPSDLRYIGGEINKKYHEYPSYSKALKKLNLKMLSLHELYGGEKVNVFENDNLHYTGELILEDNNENNKTENSKKTIMENFDDVIITESDKMIDEIIKKVKNLDNIITEETAWVDSGLKPDFEKFLKDELDKRFPDDRIVVKDKTLYFNGKPIIKIKGDETINDIALKLEYFLSKRETAPIKEDCQINEAIEKGKFTEWCREHGFEGPNISCAKKAYRTSEEARKMAVFYMNTVKPNGHDADYLTEDKDYKLSIPIEFNNESEPQNDATQTNEMNEDPKKRIQSLAGKLASELRKYSKDLEHPDFDLEKFVINMIISATHAAMMDEEDKEDIIMKIRSAGNEKSENEKVGNEEAETSENEEIPEEIKNEMEKEEKSENITESVDYFIKRFKELI
jgi:hypothetical protein